MEFLDFDLVVNSLVFSSVILPHLYPLLASQWHSDSICLGAVFAAYIFVDNLHGATLFQQTPKTHKHVKNLHTLIDRIGSSAWIPTWTSLSFCFVPFVFVHCQLCYISQCFCVFNFWNVLIIFWCSCLFIC